MNDTFIAARLQIDDLYWQGVPIYIRTGKRTMEKSTRIVIEFKELLKLPPHINDDSKEPNLLVIEIGPNEGITLQFNTSDAQQNEKIDIHVSRDDAPEAYESLINDALHGDATFFAHWDEVELSWQWVQPILEAFEENLVPLHLYAAGTYGPAESAALLAEDGYHWWLDSDSDPHNEQGIKKLEGEQYAYHTNN
jgi:glucose-6-phosphate 1-dehydrogenase